MLNPDLNIIPDQVKSIHIMGICGTGMAALASMLLQSGYSITGSDNHVYPPMSDYLYRLGIIPINGYAEDNLNHDPDLVIVGNVITNKNPEAIALANSGISYLSFPQALAEFYIKGKKSLVVTGTHGKTTTCSLLASSLYHAGLDPSFMIGGIVAEFQANNRIGAGAYFIAEGDEYDTAFFDKESKFLHYRPHIAVITSIEFDHADIFNDISQIKDSFKKFINLLPSNGLLIANLDDENVAEVTADAPCRIESYGFSNTCDWMISDIETSAVTTQYSLSYNDQHIQITIPMSGRHNCLNSVAVSAVMYHIHQPFAEIRRCQQLFQGVKRRQEIRGEVDNIRVIDDFAHHPTAVKETLAGLKNANSDRRLVAVFEPRTNSSRRAIFQNQYAAAFDDADVILLREPVPLDNVPAAQLFSSAKLASDIAKSNSQVWSFADTDGILEHLKKICKSGDIVAILSNGGFDNIHERFLKMLRNND